MSLTKINNANLSEIYSIFESCCSSPTWIEGMIHARPFSNSTALYDNSKKCFLKFNESDCLDAFSGHPQIGNLQTLNKKYANTSSLASHEQSGMSEAEEGVLEEMLQLNENYLQKFGFIFIVCASGKSAREMLDLIKNRVNNDRQSELAIAIKEQEKITQIRLEKLL